MRINEDQLLHTVDDSKSSTAARVPSFFIGKPLVDFDGGIASVSRTRLLTSELTVTVSGECTRQYMNNSLEASLYCNFVDSMHVKDVLKQGCEH